MIDGAFGRAIARSLAPSSTQSSASAGTHAHWVTQETPDGGVVTQGTVTRETPGWWDGVPGGGTVTQGTPGWRDGIFGMTHWLGETFGQRGPTDEARLYAPPAPLITQAAEVPRASGQRVVEGNFGPLRGLPKLPSTPYGPGRVTPGRRAGGRGFRGTYRDSRATCDSGAWRGRCGWLVVRLWLGRSGRYRSRRRCWGLRTRWDGRGRPRCGPGRPGRERHRQPRRRRTRGGGTGRRRVRGPGRG